MTSSDQKRIAEVEAILKQLNRSRYRNWGFRSLPRNPLARSYFDRVEPIYWDEMGCGWSGLGLARIWFLQEAIDWTGITTQDSAKLLLAECGPDDQGRETVARLTAEAARKKFDPAEWLWKSPCQSKFYGLMDDEIPF